MNLSASYCPCQMHRTIINGSGTTNARPWLMIVGEAPGEDEERAGRPFVGAAGKLLQTAIIRAGQTGAGIRFHNVVLCRPTGAELKNRTPTDDEIARCAKHVQADIDIRRPMAVLSLGKSSVTGLTGQVQEEKVGQMIALQTSCLPEPVLQLSSEIPLFVWYHPSYVLRKGGDQAPEFEGLVKVIMAIADKYRSLYTVTKESK